MKRNVMQCNEHESTIHITVRYDTCCYWFISPFLPHAVAPHNTFSYQALHHTTVCTHKQTAILELHPPSTSLTSMICVQ